MHTLPALPIHPTMRHPLTGAPIRAVWVRPDGRPCWPFMGGAPDDDGGDGGGSGGGDGGDGGGGNDDGGAGGAGGGNAVDRHGKDLGYPKDTPVAEMTADQRANYWQHQSKKHEGRFNNLVGDRSFDDVRKDLDDIAEIRKSQQTPAEQAITEAREQGKAEARAEANTKAATAIFRAQLTAQGHTEDDIDDLVDNFNVANFITDGDVDTTKLTTFAKRFSTSDTDETKQRRRDFGAGHRTGGGGQKERGEGGKSEAERRFGKTKTTTDA